MYFKSRTQAGQLLAAKLVPKYRYENCAVVALSDGGVLVGAEIARELHCVLTLLLSEDITLPGEHEPIGVVDQEGAFTYNRMFSAGQLEELTTENHTVIEQAKREKFHHINQLLGDGGIIAPELLYGHNVILVSDGLANGLSLDAASTFLKPIRTERLIIATPFATISAVDRMHILADEIECLNVVENYLGVNHYYEDNTLPSHEDTVQTIEKIVLQWR